MNPVLREGATLSLVSDSSHQIFSYYVRTSDGRSFKISRRVFLELKNADGTHKPDLKPETIEQLLRCGVLTTSRFITMAGVYNRFILLSFGTGADRWRPFCRLISRALPAASLVSLLAGLALRTSHDANTYIFHLALYVSLVFLSTICHELGHLLVGIGAGYTFTDMGVLLLGVIPVGAYVAHVEIEDANRADEIRIALAGIEGDIFISGIYMIAACVFPGQYGSLMAAADMNLVLVILNLLPIRALGLDGWKALSALAGEKHT